MVKRRLVAARGKTRLEADAKGYEPLPYEDEEIVRAVVAMSAYELAKPEFCELFGPSMLAFCRPAKTSTRKPGIGPTGTRRRPASRPAGLWAAPRACRR